ncbi:MAG: pantoate--beta-alanine ligase [Ilumatobacter sp.]|nr:pantoate--beta-alanine ligase [Ilumatobacter sp.]
MLTITTPAEMRAWARVQHAAGRSIGLVPTMGALHRGHRELIADAARRADAVVVSIFVNPLQFNEPADFDRYPRPIDDDVDVCAAAGVAAVFAPTAATMYPTGFQTRVLPGALGDVMEGPGRPGHFEGVLTVVAKLFGATAADIALFGQKDYQQLRLVTQMASDLDLGVEIVGHPIVRDDDDVAMSSRNVRLDDEQRAAAVCIPRALAAAATTAASAHDADAVVDAARAVLDDEPLAAVEYVTVFEAETLEPVESIEVGQRRPGAVRIAAAVWFGDVRLIDNRDLFDGG